MGAAVLVPWVCCLSCFVTVGDTEEKVTQGSLAFGFEFPLGRIDLRMLRCDGWENVHWSPGTVRVWIFPFFLPRRLSFRWFDCGGTQTEERFPLD